MADDLLDDLNDLGSDGEDEQILVKPAGTSHFSGADSASALGQQQTNPVQGEDMHEDGSGSDDDDDSDAPDGEVKEAKDTELERQLQALAQSGRTGLRSVARLRETKRFQDRIKRIEEALAQPSIPAVQGPLDEWPEYRLILASNSLVTALSDEQHDVHRYLCELWRLRFPELESIIPSMLDYAKAVKLIGNEIDLTKLDFGGLLPPATVMVVTVTGSTTSGKPLPEDASAAGGAPAKVGSLQESFQAADELLALESSKQSILSFIESRMDYLAPNVSVLLGTRVAAQLVGIAGGLTALSRTPSCNVQVLGQKRKTTAGLSREAAMPHAGVLFTCPIVEGAPRDLKRKAAKVLAAKVVLAARVDAHRESEGCDLGRELRAVVEQKLAKWQEPPPARQKKPLKAPDDKPGKRRGGKRYRAMKERLGMTDVRKEANRLSMTGGGDYDSVAMGVDTGMLGTGSSATGRLRVDTKKGQAEKLLGLAAKRKKLALGQGGGVGGTLSSFAFTPVQGIELVNPDAKRLKAGGVPTSIMGSSGAGTSVSAVLNLGTAAAQASYFDHSGTFTMVRGPGR